MTTLHSRNGNCVAALQPAPGDLFVVVLIAGKLALIRAVQDYEQLLGLAIAFADGTVAPNGVPFTIKVHGVSLAELLKYQGITREDFIADMKGEEADFRALSVQTCREVLRDSQDAAVRRDAHDLLVGIGGLAA
ncbi:MAG: hypothetical protein KGL48_09990 [Sphingomonadales bacterium]|nr:hypothetical protein [Sphingomonadales bacterium]